MNILHVLSQNHLTGAEVYAAELIKFQNNQGHTVHQVSNGFFAATDATKKILAVETKLVSKFIKNVFWLRRYLIDNHIHVVHTHSRAAAKLVYWSRAFLKIGVVSTVHGRQHPSISKKFFNQYGDFLIAVCETVSKQLQVDFKYNPRRISVIRNPIALSQFQFVKKVIADKQQLKIAVIGRTTGPKAQRTELILNALPAQLKKLGCNAQYYLIGGYKKDLRLNEDLPISEKSVPRLTAADYQEFDLVIGSGRVAAESILAGVPTISFGEAKYVGLVTVSNLAKDSVEDLSENLAEHFQSNFGDMDTKFHTPTLDLKKLAADVETFLRGSDPKHLETLSRAVAKEFGSEKISLRIQRLYESAYFLRNYSRWIPILMYHKIPDQELQSQHKIFVTKKRFETHLMLFKFLGFQTVTFSDLKKFKSGLVDFSTFPKKPLILTFDDGYKDNLEHASPLLEMYNFKAQLFLLADTKIASNQWDHSETEPPHEIVSGSDRKLWKQSAFAIGSHGFSHKKMTQMTEDQARLELQKSKQDLQAEFETDIPVYAFTYGDTNAKAATWAFEEGYDYAVNTDTGGLLLEENPHQIFRVNIFPDESLLSLFKKTSSWYRNYYFRKRKK